MAIPTDIKERTAADLSAAANDFLSRMAKLGRTASSFFNPTLPHLGGVQLELYIDLNPG